MFRESVLTATKCVGVVWRFEESVLIAARVWETSRSLESQFDCSLGV